MLRHIETRYDSQFSISKTQTVLKVNLISTQYHQNSNLGLGQLLLLRSMLLYVQ